MQDSIIEWGVYGKSKVILESDGECDVVTHYNELSPPPEGFSDFYTDSIGEHAFVIDFGHYDLPDVFTIIPAYGWEVIGENSVVVAEGAKALVRVCQMLIG